MIVVQSPLHARHDGGMELHRGALVPSFESPDRVDQGPAGRDQVQQPGVARAHAVTLSYNEAGRWLDAQERVDNVPLGAELREWLQAYTDATYRPEPKQRRRPASFVTPGERK